MIPAKAGQGQTKRYTEERTDGQTNKRTLVSQSRERAKEKPEIQFKQSNNKKKRQQQQQR